MLRRLYLENAFKHHQAEFLFQPGATTILGENESGKSLILEMCRAGLFGSAALRGKSDDYKKLVIELDFEIRGEAYKVRRAGSRVLLSDSKGKPLSSGTTAVNLRIKNLFGYGLDVFDVANCCNQGEVEALSAMKPAERRAMLEETIGLTSLDQLIIWFNEQNNSTQKIYEALSRGVVEPIPPIEPLDYQASNILEALKAPLLKKQEEYLILKGWLSHILEEPKEPTTTIRTPVNILEAAVSERSKLEQELIKIKSQLALNPIYAGFQQEMAYGPSLTLRQLKSLEKQWTAYDLWLEKCQVYKKEIQPLSTLEEIEETRKQWALYQRWLVKKTLLDKGTTTCPKCGAVYPLAQEALAEYADVEETPKPTVSTRDLDTIEYIIGRWNAIDHAKYELVKEVKKPDLPRKDIEFFKDNLGRREEIDRLAAQTKGLEVQLATTPDLSKDLQARKQFELEMKNYILSIASYKAYQVEYQTKSLRAAQLETTESELTEVDSRLRIALAYEQQIELYKAAKATYDAAMAELNIYQTRIEQLGKGKLAIKELKNRIKSYLIPSLSTAASVLVSQMTSGTHNQVAVDEDFDVLVDLQPLATLSGSTKAVANLALRIGLGQVLTNKVFSVFLGDELDASMDDERATATYDCLRRLSENSVQQVILVSHKNLPADRTINLS